MTSGGWTPRLLRPEARGAFLALLHGLRRLDDEGRSTPCQLEPDRFTSEDRSERAAATALCATCPVRRRCSVYAEAQRERWGVWGGRDRGPKWTVNRGAS